MCNLRKVRIDYLICKAWYLSRIQEKKTLKKDKKSKNDVADEMESGSDDEVLIDLKSGLEAVTVSNSK
jgi:MinD-like ATPase involved in chromosome partitioning or flagellar assembly